jgi:hypothetical protein
MDLVRVGALAAVIIQSASLLLSGLSFNASSDNRRIRHRRDRHPRAGLRGDRVSATLAPACGPRSTARESSELPLMRQRRQGQDEWLL